MPAEITIQFSVPLGYLLGDYAQLNGNGGSGSIDWGSPLSSEILPLFPGGAGIYGFGHAPFGHFRFGKAHSMRTAGFGHLPFGHFPFGHGTAIITANHRTDSCGYFRFGFAVYDGCGNVHVGTPEEALIDLHTAPPAPTGLKKKSYNKTTDVLVLEAL